MSGVYTMSRFLKFDFYQFALLRFWDDQVDVYKYVQNWQYPNKISMIFDRPFTLGNFYEVIDECSTKEITAYLASLHQDEVEYLLYDVIATGHIKFTKINQCDLSGIKFDFEHEWQPEDFDYILKCCDANGIPEEFKGIIETLAESYYRQSI